MPEQSRGKDARVVEDEQISAAQVTAELTEHHVVDPPITVEDEQPRAAALVRRKLRDQFLR